MDAYKLVIAIHQPDMARSSQNGFRQGQRTFDLAPGKGNAQEISGQHALGRVGDLEKNTHLPGLRIQEPATLANVRGAKWATAAVKKPGSASGNGMAQQGPVGLAQLGQQFIPAVVGQGEQWLSGSNRLAQAGDTFRDKPGKRRGDGGIGQLLTRGRQLRLRRRHRAFRNTEFRQVQGQVIWRRDAVALELPPGDCHVVFGPEPGQPGLFQRHVSRGHGGFVLCALNLKQRRARCHTRARKGRLMHRHHPPGNSGADLRLPARAQLRKDGNLGGHLGLIHLQHRHDL